MCTERGIYALKAGKLGFSELACAYDGWVARFGPPNARVHIMSRNLTASREQLAAVKFGLKHLPDWMRLPVVTSEAGGDTSTSLKLLAGIDDVRTVISYASGADVSIDQTCTHLHADEFARWPYGATTWAAALSTISPYGGSLHIVSRGRGRNWAGKVYNAAQAGKVYTPGRDRVRSFFAPWWMRADRDDEWYELQRLSYSEGQLGQWAPAKWQEALMGDAGLVFPMFENPEGRHVQSLERKYPLASCWRKGVGIDPGGGDPTAMCLIGEFTREMGRTHQYAERTFRGGASIEDIAGVLVEWAELAEVPHANLRVVVDHAGGTVLIESLAAYGFDAVPADKDKDTGLRLMTQRYNRDMDTIEPRCVETIEEHFDYQWQEEDDQSGTKVKSGRTQKHHADHIDGRRYLLMDFAQYEPEEPIVLPGGLRL